MQRDEVMEILGRNEKIFTEIPGRESIIKHGIDLTDERLLRCKPYLMPYLLRGEIQEEIKITKESGIIRDKARLVHLL